MHAKVRNHNGKDSGKSTPRKSALNMNTKGVTVKVRNRVCGDCGFTTSVKSNLKRHSKEVHEKSKSNVCGDCGYAASRKITLKKLIEGCVIRRLKITSAESVDIQT